MSVDVMMPFYGDVEQFKSAVTSVRSQEHSQWRLVVVDDCYPNLEAGRWLQSLGDSRITYVRNKTNLGVAGNFQRCIELTRAKYSIIMGCDDLMLPGYLTRVLELSKAYPQAHYIQPGVEVIDSSGDVVRPLADRVKLHFRPKGPFPRLLGGEPLAQSLLLANWTYFPSICWRTSELRKHGFRSEFRIVLDLALQLAIIRDGGTLALDDEKVFQYRRHDSTSSWTGSGALRFHEEKALFRETAKWASKSGWTKAARAARLHPTSRLHALSHAPAALRSPSSVRDILTHAFR